MRQNGVTHALGVAPGELHGSALVQRRKFFRTWWKTDSANLRNPQFING
jgi:hypothetical protein